jgi:hypothetical protein
MRRAAIIVTFDDSELWEQSETWPRSSFPATPVRATSVGDDTVLILCQAKSKKRGEKERVRDSRGITTPWLIELSQSETYGTSFIYVAAHAGYADFVQIRKQIPDGRFHAGAYFNHRAGEMYDTLRALTAKVEEKTVKAVIECIEQHQERTYSDRLRTLKHRLAHVFLPVTVDLHAWQEFGFDDLYLQELRRAYEKDEGRLERARSLLYDDDTSPEDSVEKLIRENNLLRDEAWTQVQLLLPPESTEKTVNRDDPGEYQSFLTAKALLESLKDPQKLRTLRTELREHDSFGSWCKDLDNHLSQLVRKLDQ